MLVIAAGAAFLLLDSDGTVGSAVADSSVAERATAEQATVTPNAPDPTPTPGLTPLPTREPMLAAAAVSDDNEVGDPEPTVAPEPTVPASPTATPDAPTPTPDAPTPTAVPEVEPVALPTRYVTEDQVTLNDLAERYGIEPELLQAANPDLDPNQIPSGTEVLIPSAQGEVPEDASFQALHRVIGDDTVESIAEQYGIPEEALRESNELAADDPVQEGSVLVIPEAGQSEQADQDEEPPAPQTHTVVANETLSGIALRYGVTVADLMEANDLEDPNYIRVGWTLTIPRP